MVWEWSVSKDCENECCGQNPCSRKQSCSTHYGGASKQKGYSSGIVASNENVTEQACIAANNQGMCYQDRRLDMINVRPYTPNDRTFILSLAPRLAIGKQPWRDSTLWLKTVEEWLAESINQHNQKTMVLIAENEQGEPLGFATVSHSTHFTGQRQAYIGELATSENAEGRGVGTALVEACVQWAREQRYTILTLTTGAGNTRALRFYDHLGFQIEDVKLTKLL
jgi:ribosomal protein S18 acetylase RimI-like enzyme